MYGVNCDNSCLKQVWGGTVEACIVMGVYVNDF